ncbi:MAG: ABC transporter permease [Actinomycetota bacterium]|nr:ABC transporter permease [Actinomycetota bacterium]
MSQAISDTLVLAKRNLIRIVRAPDLLTAFTIQPVMFVLLFVYVFGGAIQVPPIFAGYADFLIPGIVVQNIAFGGFATALGLSADLQQGLIDRFRSLPMARSAVLAGRTIADIATNLLSMSILIGVGLLVGFEFNAPITHVLLGILLMIMLGYAFSWVFAYIGMISSTPEAANAFGFMTIFPLTFISSAFVPVESMPAALEAFANANPFTTAVDAMRHLWQGAPASTDVWVAFLWTIAITIVFFFISTAKYKSATSK